MEWDFFQRLVDQLPVALFGKDARLGQEGQFRIWNRAAEQLFGIPAQDILGKTDFDLFPPEQASYFAAKDREVMGGRERVEYPKEAVDSPTLGRRWVRTVKVPLYASDGGPEMLVGISEDITRLLSQEEAIHHKERSLAEAQRIGHMGNWEWDIKAETLTWSDEIFRIFGLAPGAIAPSYEDFLARIHPQDRLQVEQAVAQALKGHGSYSTDHRVVRPSGEVLFVHEKGEVEFDAEGQPLRMVGTIQDITARSQVERLQKEFVSTVSHELRSPLTAIRGALGLALGDPARTLDPATRELLMLGLRNSERLGRIINDILDISKIEAGALELALVPLDLAATVRKAVELHAPLGAAKGLRFSQSNEVKATIFCDEERLLQILGNMLSNASKYSPEGGEVHAASSVEGDQARVTIRNHGPAIPAHFRENIFKKFAQADASDSRAKSGTGLGLSISKALVERMGGRIGFESYEASTQFWCEFPLLGGLSSPDSNGTDTIKAT